MKKLCLTVFLTVLCLYSVNAREKDLTVLYWNIQNGMWSGQYDNYKSFVKWVSGKNPDICIFCEAESIYRTGTNERLPNSDRYLVRGWKELAGRYGHRYVYVSGHRDSYPQVITSRFPIENVEKIVGNDTVVVTHGAGWVRVRPYGRTLNIVSLHTWPEKSHFRYKKASREARDSSAARHEGDINRLEEMTYICSRTILTDPEASRNLWLMAGDFNAVSPKDNWVYKYPADAPMLYVHDYILKNTPYMDVIWERSRRNFYTTTFERKRIDFVYLSPALFDMVGNAEIIEDEYTAPQRDKNARGFHIPSDHLPIIVKFKLK